MDDDALVLAIVLYDVWWLSSREGMILRYLGLLMMTCTDENDDDEMCSSAKDKISKRRRDT